MLETEHWPNKEYMWKEESQKKLFSRKQDCQVRNKTALTSLINS